MKAMEFLADLEEIKILEAKKNRTIEEENRLKFLTLKIYDPKATDIIGLIETYNALLIKHSEKTISKDEIQVFNSLKQIYFD